MIAFCFFDLGIISKFLETYTATLFVVIVARLSKVYSRQNFFKAFEKFFP